MTCDYPGFCAGFSDTISKGNQWWDPKMLAVFLGQGQPGEVGWLNTCSSGFYGIDKAAKSKVSSHNINNKYLNVFKV